MISATKKHIHDLYYLAKELEEQLEESGYPSRVILEYILEIADTLMNDYRFEEMLETEVEITKAKKDLFNHKWSIPEKFFLDE